MFVYESFGKYESTIEAKQSSKLRLSRSAMESPEAKATVTQNEQWMVEGQVFGIYKQFSELPRRAQTVMLELARDKHAEYLSHGLRRLPPSFCVLDANRPWLCYWIIHSLALLGESIDTEMENDIIDFLGRCQDPNGGYGGGPGQMPHLATTYAAVNSLITLGGHRALSSINRMHEMGELDVRACYTAISVASILNILDGELVENVGNYILSCQTYEGGISGEPSSEAHGGYTFCGLATTILINEVHRLDLPALMNWVAFRQGVEGGFQGRTNKLVDGCYSFWQGGVFPLIQRLGQIIDNQLEMIGTRKQDCSSSSLFDPSERTHALPKSTCKLYRNNTEQEGLECAPSITNLYEIGLDFVKHSADMGPLFHTFALQQYIILCCQVVNGGFRDKPGKGRDFYHACYCLSGLSACQYSGVEDADSSPLPQQLLGPYSNLLEATHPLYIVALERFYEARDFFSSSS